MKKFIKSSIALLVTSMITMVASTAMATTTGSNPASTTKNKADAVTPFFHVTNTGGIIIRDKELLIKNPNKSDENPHEFIQRNYGDNSVLIGGNTFNDASSNTVVLGANSLLKGSDSTLIGSNSQVAGSSNTVIASNTKIGVVGKYLNENGNIELVSITQSPRNVIIGDGNTICYDNQFYGENTIVGQGSKATGEKVVMLGQKAESTVGGTAIGHKAKATVDGGIALGRDAKSDRAAGVSGYNPVTGHTYEEDLAKVLPEEDYARLIEIEKEMESVREEREQILNDIATAKDKMLALEKKASDTIFDNETQFNEFNNEFTKASEEYDDKYFEQYTNEAFKKHKKLTKEKEELLGKYLSKQGALSIGEEGGERQLINLAAGSEDTDAVNVRQLKDLAEAHREKNDQTNKRFNALDQRMNRLDKKMEKGLASQAALNGLFQPYSVGSHNLTMAVGGYKSQQAIAIGTGYRFNRKFAVKAGIAAPTSGFNAASYNVGMNIEW